MPTAAKLVAGIFFAALGYFAADVVKPFLPEGTQTGWMNEIIAAIGFIMGWIVLGNRVGNGTLASIGYGLTVVFLMAFWSIVAFSLIEMVQLSMDRRYRGPMHALQSMIGIGLRDLRLLGNAQLIVTMIVGGAFGGWVSEWASKRWT